ncbi:MAG: triose-phosphate isomerase [Candidatus Eisenbacteria bacterium]|nr:triose-phosphate isomerase [Candidatus Eisenbacteria bacterium]
MRAPLIAGNWKMHHGPRAAESFVRAFLEGFHAVPPAVEVLLVPPFASLAAVHTGLLGRPVAVGAQLCHWETRGAFTGEVSTEMLAECGCAYVLVAHSERRQFFGETDETARKRVVAAKRAGLKPILCVGEMLAERDGGQTEAVLERQLDGALLGLDAGELEGLVIAYEPVWAIGTGRTATTGQAQETHKFIRGWLKARFDARFAEATRIQYGGSVKPDNARALLGQPDVDGALVGGASLDAASFLAIAAAAG